MNINDLIDDKYYYELDSILLKIACIKYPYATRWCEFISNTLFKFKNVKCLICEAIIDPDVNGVRRHGVQHLIDKNLLPFI